MKKKIFVFVIMVAAFVMLTGCVTDTTAKIITPTANTKAGTPTPNDQITIPSVSFQISLPGPNPLLNQVDSHNRVTGILLGIWHGIISPITLIVSFVNPKIQMYEVHNDGSPYNFGFLFGVALIFLILGASAGSRRRS
jgi:hypothetical protein